MRVAVIAGPDAGHAVPAVTLCIRFLEAGDDVLLFTGERWKELASRHSIPYQKLVGLEPTPGDADLDFGKRIHARAARMALLLAPLIAEYAPDLVVSDILTAGGSLAAELVGLPWAELSPHPLYLPSAGLPPVGSGLARGQGVTGKLRDMTLRALTVPSLRAGHRQRRAARAAIGLPREGVGPVVRLIAALPALEVSRPDWPHEAVLVGPLLTEVSGEILAPPPGDAPLVVIAPSTAALAVPGLSEIALNALSPDVLGIPVRVVVSVFEWEGPPLPEWAVAGVGRQDVLFEQAKVVICGGGHGVLAKALLAGVPAVVVPGAGDQWEVAKRAERLGVATVIRPLEVSAVSDAVRKLLTSEDSRSAARRAGESMRRAEDPVRVCHSVITCG